jgi:quinol monooxygenase YgiN
MSATIGFAVVYRWQLHAGKEEQFRDAWETVTTRLMKDHGALGSRLHDADDGTVVAYAQWPSKQAWEDSRQAAPCDEAAFAAMRDATARTFDPILLTPRDDHLLPAGSLTADPREPAMNWVRVFLFAAIGFGVLFAVGFAAGFIEEKLTNAGSPVPPSFVLIKVVTLILAEMIVFGWLTYRQRSRALLHVLASFFLIWAASFVPNVVVQGAELGDWFSGMATHFVFAMAGCGAGYWIRRVFGETEIVL